MIEYSNSRQIIGASTQLLTHNMCQQKNHSVTSLSRMGISRKTQKSLLPSSFQKKKKTLCCWQVPGLRLYSLLVAILLLNHLTLNPNPLVKKLTDRSKNWLLVTSFSFDFHSIYTMNISYIVRSIVDKFRPSLTYRVLLIFMSHYKLTLTLAYL